MTALSGCVISCIKGYAYGVRGWDLRKPVVAIVSDLKKSTTQTISSLLQVPKTKQASGYTAATFLLVAMKLAKVKEIIGMLASSSSQSNMLVPLARLARLSLFTAVVFSLKDAADRRMLEGENIIQLNLLSAASFGSLAAFVLKGSTSTTQLPESRHSFPYFVLAMVPCLLSKSSLRSCRSIVIIVNSLQPWSSRLELIFGALCQVWGEESAFEV